MLFFPEFQGLFNLPLNLLDLAQKSQPLPFLHGAEVGVPPPALRLLAQLWWSTSTLRMLACVSSCIFIM